MTKPQRTYNDRMMFGGLRFGMRMGVKTGIFTWIFMWGYLIYFRFSLNLIIFQVPNFQIFLFLIFCSTHFLYI